MSDTRPAISELIKRVVRKRCGFGCVICGAQPYDYDHMIEYEIVKCHEAENLTLLCKQHHGEKTLKNLTLDVVQEANVSPYNLRHNTSKSRYLYYSGKNVEVNIGGNIFTYSNLAEGFEFVPLQIDGVNIISFIVEDNRLLLNFVAYDLDNNKIVEIQKNEIIHSTIVWDAKWSANSLTFREGNGKYLIDISFKTPNIIIISRGYIHYNKTDIIINNDLLFIANNKTCLVGNHSENCKIGLSVKGMPAYTENWKEIKTYVQKEKKKRKH